MTATARFWRNLSITVAAIVLVSLAYAITSASLHDPSFFTGWLLLGTLIFLTLFNIRKKLPFLPLGTAAAWLSFHVYAGWFSLALFLLHIDLRVPDGALETTLAVLYLAVALSGIAGLMISRSFAKRLTRRGEEVIFERIPVFRKQIRDEAGELVLRSVSDLKSTTIADFYASRLKSFFDRPRNFVQHLFGSNRARFAMQTELQSLGRYLSTQEEEILAKLSEVVRHKDDLDYHYALQATLKGWLFFHVPLTYSMLILALVHMVLAYALTGGMP